MPICGVALEIGLVFCAQHAEGLVHAAIGKQICFRGHPKKLGYPDRSIDQAGWEV
jgi:hypothetical protein